MLIQFKIGFIIAGLKAPQKYFHLSVGNSIMVKI